MKKETIIVCDRCERATGNYVEAYESDEVYCEPCAGYLEMMFEAAYDDYKESLTA